MTKKGHHKFWRMKIDKFSTEFEKFFRNRGKFETMRKCIIAWGGMDAPAGIHA